jgi:hypothetical protein
MDQKVTVSLTEPEGPIPAVPQQRIMNSQPASQDCVCFPFLIHDIIENDPTRVHEDLVCPPQCRAGFRSKGLRIDSKILFTVLLSVAAAGCLVRLRAIRSRPVFRRNVRSCSSTKYATKRVAKSSFSIKRELNYSSFITVIFMDSESLFIRTCQEIAIQKEFSKRGYLF